MTVAAQLKLDSHLSKCRECRKSKRIENMCQAGRILKRIVEGSK